MEQLLDSNKHLSWATRVKLACEIAMGLGYLHSKGIFHRDLTSKVSGAQPEAGKQTCPTRQVTTWSVVLPAAHVMFRLA